MFSAASHLRAATVYFTEFSSPIGTIQLRGTEAALTGVFMEHNRHEPSPLVGAVHDAGPLRSARRELEEYFGGERREFSVALAPAGTPFQMRVWQALCEIPYGTTINYRNLAQSVGSPRGFRAVGQANGRNPISIIVPCHRVIAADGSLGGYGGGPECKSKLLELEGVRAK